jgi:hypothetical protein
LLQETTAGDGRQSSAWYMRKMINAKIGKPTEKYWDRIANMKILIKK